MTSMTWGLTAKTRSTLFFSSAKHRQKATVSTSDPIIKSAHSATTASISDGKHTARHTDVHCGGNNVATSLTEQIHTPTLLVEKTHHATSSSKPRPEKPKSGWNNLEFVEHDKPSSPTEINFLYLSLAYPLWELRGGGSTPVASSFFFKCVYLQKYSRTVLLNPTF